MCIYDSYYVYAYLRKSDFTPYYIGKGKGNRINEKHKGLSIPKDKKFRIMVETNLTNLGACAIERRLIRWYGRKDIKTGLLLNKTEGGDGWFSKHNERTKKLISEKQKGKKRPRTKDHENKLSHNSKYYEITFPNGDVKIIYNINRFARQNNLCSYALRSVAYGKQNRTQHKGYRVRRLNPKEIEKEKSKCI